MQIPKSYCASDKAMKNRRITWPLISALITLLCTACGSEGQPADQQDDFNTTHPLPPTAYLSPLSDENWEYTLERVIDVVNVDTRNVLFDAAIALRLPSGADSAGIVVTEEPVTFVLSDGTPGTSTTASCEAGGGFQLVSTSSDFERALIDADDCLLGSWSIDGRVERVTSTTDIESLTFENFSVDIGHQRVNVSSALYERMDGHPVATTIWKGMSYSVEENSRVITVHDFEWNSADIFGTAFDRSMSLSFTISGSWSNDQPLFVSTPVTFGGLTTSETGRDYTRGKLVLETDEVNRLTLDVDSGEPDLVLVTLERDGVVTTHVWPRPDALR